MIRKGSLAYQRLFARDEACVWHGRDCDPETLVPHHRGGRGMGGRESMDGFANLTLLCSEYNHLVEHDAEIAEDARWMGVKISSHADPCAKPILHQQHGVVLLDDDGGFEHVEVDCMSCLDQVFPDMACAACGRDILDDGGSKRVEEERYGCHEGN